MLTRSEARAFSNFDSQLPRESVEHEPWVPMTSPRATVQQLEDFIERLALTGNVEDEFGEVKSLKNTLFQAVAIDWMDGKMKLPAHTYLSFERWATAVCENGLRRSA